MILEKHCTTFSTCFKKVFYLFTCLNVGNIKYGDLFNALPYQNDVMVVTIKGRFIRDVLKISAFLWKTGQFLQISGMKVVYAVRNNSIIVSSVLVSSEGHILKEINDDKEYKVRQQFV